MGRGSDTGVGPTPELVAFESGEDLVDYAGHDLGFLRGEHLEHEPADGGHVRWRRRLLDCGSTLLGEDDEG